MVKITFNGTAAEVEEGCPLTRFLKKHKWTVENLIVELNGEILDPRLELPETCLHAGDTLNVFKIVSGG